MQVPTTALLALCLAFYFDRYAQPYVALLLALVIVYAVFDLASWSPRVRNSARWVLLTLIVMLLVVTPTLVEIQQRLATSPSTHTHDGAIQTEEAIRFFAAGKNPYVEDYVQTPMAHWENYFGAPPEELPILQHLLYLPLNFILPLPLYAIWQLEFGWFDIRLYHILVFVILFFALFQLTPEWESKLGVGIFVALQPLFAPFFIEGRNDVVVLLWLVTAFLCVQRRHITMAALALGLACATKTTAWFVAPFLLAQMWWTGERRWSVFFLHVCVPFAIVSLVVFVPFLIWDASAFISDITWFQTYPFAIDGSGFSRLLLDIGIISDPLTSFPFGILQIIVTVTGIIVLLCWQAKRPTLQRMVAAAAVLGLAVGYVARWVTDSYLGFYLSLGFIALFIGPMHE